MLADGRTLFLELPDLQPVHQLHLRLHVAPPRAEESEEEAAGMDPAAGDGVDLFATVHRLDGPFTEFPGYRPTPKTIRPHPMEVDLALATRRVPNPWRQPIEDARPVRLEVARNLAFAERTIAARAGEAIRFTLVNPDVVPHNWVLARTGSLERVGEAANRWIADPEAYVRHYVPLSDDVLVHTDIVPPRGELTIYFRAPAEPGRYPYLCTFPGHWMVMNGELVVR